MKGKYKEITWVGGLNDQKSIFHFTHKTESSKWMHACMCLCVGDGYENKEESDQQVHLCSVTILFAAHMIIVHTRTNILNKERRLKRVRPLHHVCWFGL